MLVYGIAISILGLSVPLSVQVLIGSVVNSALVNQVLVLSVILFTVLILSSFFMAIQNYLMELFERNYFARVMPEVALRLLYAAQHGLNRTNRGDLVNRYFDIMTVQKSVPPLLTGGLATALQTIAGITVTSFYHPIFLMFNLVTVLTVYLVFRIFDRAAGNSAVALSTSKYQAGRWLEEIAQSSTFYQSERTIEYALRRTRDVRDEYILRHRRHFRFTFTQAVGFLCIYAVASSTLLGLGGWLVIRGQLTIGQLVAAELILAAIFYNLTRGIYYLELYYDLYAALTKLLQLIAITPENINQKSVLDQWQPSIEFQKARYQHDRGDLLFDFSVAAGENVLVVARSSIQEYAVSDLIRNYAEATSGGILIGDHDIADFNAHKLRNDIIVIDASPLPICSMSEFLHIANPNLSAAEMRNLLDIVGLNSDQSTIARALDETLMPDGYPLSPVGVLKLKIAFAFAIKPKIMVLTTQFDTLSQEARLDIGRHLKTMTDTTVLCFTHRPDLVDFDRYLFCDFNKQQQCTNVESLFQAYSDAVATSDIQVDADGGTP